MTAVILVVEDQPAMQRNIRMGLEMSDYTVVVAADGIEALAVLNAQPIDLILADVGMPRMNGYQLYEELRRQPRWALIPLVFVSARALDSDIRYAKALGADDYLVKPFQLEDLLAIVAGRLRRTQEMARAVAAPAGRRRRQSRRPKVRSSLPATCASTPSSIASGKTECWWNSRRGSSPSSSI